MIGRSKAKADGWYLLHEGKRHGPFPISAFLQAVEEGTINKDHLIWRPGWDEWRSGSAAAELLAIASTIDTSAPLTTAVPPPPPKVKPVEVKPVEIKAVEIKPVELPKADPATRVDQAVKAVKAVKAAEPVQAAKSPLFTNLAAASTTDSYTRAALNPVDEGSESYEELSFLQDDLARFAAGDHAPEESGRNYGLGELSLPKSYWVNMLLAVIAISFSAFALQAALQNSGVQSGPMTFAAWGLFCAVVLVIVAWQLVGVWRSASQREERGGSPFWARAAQAMVVVGASAAVISGVTGSLRFASSSTLAAASAAEKVKDALTRIPVYATLQRLDPAAFDTITGQVAQEFQQGASEEVIFADARTALDQTVRQYTPRASEEAILDMTEVLIAYMSALQASDPESCVAINDQSTGARLRVNLLKQFPDIFDRELAVNERILTSGANSSQPIPAEPQIKPQLATIQTELTRRFDRQLGLLAKKDLAPSEYATYCQVARALLEEVRKLPPNQAADLLRYVYAQS